MTPFMFPEINPKSKIKWQEMSAEERREFTKESNKGLNIIIAFLAFIVGFIIPISEGLSFIDSSMIAVGFSVGLLLLYTFIDKTLEGRL